MHGREISRKRSHMMIILLRVISQCLFAQLPAHPREIKRMFQEMLPRDVIVDLIEILIHKFCFEFGSMPVTAFHAEVDARDGKKQARNGYVFLMWRDFRNELHAWSPNESEK